MDDYTEINEFVEVFSGSSGNRLHYINDFIDSSNRFMMNIPVIGSGRKVSKKLREGPFSDLYEFERTMATRLHPILASLNLNVISDVIINREFDERFILYNDDFIDIVNSINKLGLAELKDLILAMVDQDGHYMVVKFYDLELRKYDLNLFKSLKPIELTVIQMKRSLTENEEENLKTVKKQFTAFLNKYGESDGRLLIKRMEWDTLLVKYIIELNKLLDSGNYSGSELGSEPEIDVRTGEVDNTDDPVAEDEFVSGDEHEDVKEIVTDVETGSDGSSEIDKIPLYAKIIKRDFLDKKNDDDEEGIRKIVDILYNKNEKIFGSSEAEDIEKRVIQIWLDDEKISQEKKDILSGVLSERFGEIEAGEDTAYENSPEDQENFEAEDELNLVVPGGIDDPGDASGSFEVAEEETQEEMGNFDIAEGGQPETIADDDVEAEGSESLEIDDDIEPAGLNNSEVVEQLSADDLQPVVPGETPGSFIISEEESPEELGSFDMVEELSPEDLKPVIPADADEAGEVSGSFDIAEEEAPEEPGSFDIADESSDEDIDPVMSTEADTTSSEDPGRFSISGDDAPEEMGSFDTADEISVEDVSHVNPSEIDGIVEESGSFPVAEKDASEEPGNFEMSKTDDGEAGFDDMDSSLISGEDAPEDSGSFTIAEEDISAGDMKESVSSKEDEISDEINEFEINDNTDSKDVPGEVDADNEEYLMDEMQPNDDQTPDDLKIAAESGKDLNDEINLDIKEEVIFDGTDGGLGITVDIDDRETEDENLEKITINDKEINVDDNSVKLDELLKDSIGKFNSADDMAEVSKKSGISQKARNELLTIVKADAFEAAFQSITKSADFGPGEKIICMERWLKVVGEQRGWFEEGREEKLGKIDKMIEYYSKFLKKGIINTRKSRGESANDGLEKVKADNKKVDNDKPNKKIPRKKDTAGDQNDNLEETNEEKVFNRFSSIIKAFSDNILCIDLLYNNIIKHIPDEYKEEIEKQVGRIKSQKDLLVSRTIAMIEIKKPDESIIESLNKSTSMQQYIWGQDIIKKKGVAKLEDIFKIFEKDKDFYKELSKIIRVINLNNKNDLLKKKAADEELLIKQILSNLSKDKLKEIWTGTRNRQNKDKIKLIRDLVDLTGDIEPVSGDVQEKDNNKKIPIEVKDFESGKDLSVEKADVQHMNEKEVEFEKDHKSPEVARIANDIEEFQTLYKSEKLRNLAMKRVPSLNNFFKNLAIGEESTRDFVINHNEAFLGFLKFIISEHPELKNSFQTSEAMVYCKSNNLIQF